MLVSQIRNFKKRNQHSEKKIIYEEYEGEVYPLEELKNPVYKVRYDKKSGTLIFINQCPVCNRKHKHGRINKKVFGAGDGYRSPHCIPFIAIMKENEYLNSKNKFTPKYYHNGDYQIKEI